MLCRIWRLPVTDLRIIVDGDERNVAPDTTASDLWPDTNPPKVVAARVGGELKDLAYVLADGDAVEPVLIASPDGRAILRHSTAHVMAQAVQDLFPGTLLGIGPPIENGFYYDFLPERSFHPDDLDRIERRMREIVKAGQRFARRPVFDVEARAELADE